MILNLLELKCMNSQIFQKMKFYFLRKNVNTNFKRCDFFKSSGTYFHFLKIYSTGFYYSLISSK